MGREKIVDLKIMLTVKSMPVLCETCSKLRKRIQEQYEKYFQGLSQTSRVKLFCKIVNISYPLIHTHTCVYQGARNVNYFRQKKLQYKCLVGC